MLSSQDKFKQHLLSKVVNTWRIKKENNDALESCILFLNPVKLRP